MSEELTPEEIAEQEKQERIQGYKERLCCLHDIQGLSSKLGWTDSNPMKRVMDVIEQDDESELLLLESKVDELQAEADANKTAYQTHLSEKESAQTYISDLNIDSASEEELKECIRCLVKMLR